MSNYNNYLTTWYGKELLKKHTLDEYGIWQVRGEDPNCDLGGSHHMPDMGVYEGKLRDIIMAVTAMPMFWTWGAGGKIIKTNIIPVTPETVSLRNVKRQELKEAEAKVKKLRQELDLDH